MSQKLQDIIKNTQTMTESSSVLEIIMDFERVLDELNLYAFRNWKLGELVQGPIIDRYRVSCWFMWPRRLMPDPRGGQRLLKFGVRTRWGQDHLVYPRVVKSQSDFRPGTKKPKLDRVPVWRVEIIMPKNLIKQVENVNFDFLERTLDLTDIDSAYETDFEKLSNNQEHLQDQTQADIEKSQGEL